MPRSRLTAALPWTDVLNCTQGKVDACTLIVRARYLHLAFALPTFEFTPIVFLLPKRKVGHALGLSLGGPLYLATIA